MRYTGDSGQRLSIYIAVTPEPEHKACVPTGAAFFHLVLRAQSYRARTFQHRDGYQLRAGELGSICFHSTRSILYSPISRVFQPAFSHNVIGECELSLPS